MKTASDSIPTATYRLQFNKQFTFRDASALVPYLHALGVSHVYASPFFKANPESTHGYDISNHNELNPALGTREEFDALVAALHTHGMGLIVDFVPNHMGIATPYNDWWNDVLENGPSSIYAPNFDIEWHPLAPSLEQRVLLPILGDQFGRVLERGELKLEFSNGAFFLRYCEHRLPLAPRTYAAILQPALEKILQNKKLADAIIELQSILTAIAHLPQHTEGEPEKIAELAREKEVIKRRLARLCEESAPVREAIDESMHAIEGRVGEPRSFDTLEELINAQCYRLSFWRVAAEEINYRRFFDINNLAAIRMELPEVFAEAHRLIFELIDKGAVNGLRIDHVDGLWDPREYLEKLRAGAPRLSYLVVEKILLGNETLRGDWPVDGTTGYDFTNQIMALLIDREAEKSLTDTYHKFIGGTPRYSDIVYHTKRLVMRLSLASEINMLGHMLDRLSEKNRWYRDFTLNALTTAVREVIACFPVYRTYVSYTGEPDEADREAVLRAIRLAKRRNPGVERSVFNFLGEILLKRFPENIDAAAREEHLRFVMKFQQCTGPIMAKGVEDTAFYIYNRLTALNEVGGEPDLFGSGREKFHAACLARRRNFPRAMLATTTHDTKRSEDVRARLAAISEMPAEWRKAVRGWAAINRKWKTQIDGELAPDANEEYLIYQTLAGTWPACAPGHSSPAEAHESYIRRLQDYAIKAIKEAKVNSSWIQPNEEWENAVREFIAKLLRKGTNRFLDSFRPLAEKIAQLGAINGLTQLAIKCTTPGVPDFYQGSELWDFRLVDPDNRQPVDYGARRQALESIGNANPAELFQNWRDGRIKLFVAQKLLRFRREHAPFFQRADYVPLKTCGAFAECCIAFERRWENKTLIVAAPRLSSRVGFPPLGQAWRDTAIEFASPFTGPFRDVLTGVEIAGEKIAQDTVLFALEALRVLPLAVLQNFA